MSNPAPKPIPLALAATQIRNADLLISRRGRGLFSRSIAAVGTTFWTHIGMAVWCHATLMCAEVIQWHGGRVVTLASQVEQYPGQIDWFQSDYLQRFDRFDRSGACQVMLQLAGSPYGWRDIARVAVLHLPVARLWAIPDTDDRESGAAPYFCSGAVSYALRTGGQVDVVPNLSDRETEPHHFANASFCRYRGTLV